MLRHMKLIALAALVAFVIADDTAKEREEKYGTIIGIDLGTTYSW